MTDRKNLKIDADTYAALREEKGRFETWDQTLHRILSGEFPDPEGGREDPNA